MKLSKIYYWILPALVMFSIASCHKDNSLGFTPGTGAPVITSVSKISNSVVDSSRTSSVITYDASGNPTTVTSPNYNAQVVGLDSATVTGTLSGYYVMNGSNLGSTSNIAINGVSIYFNRALSSDKSLVFTIPTTIPYVQPQANTIVVTTLHGTATYKFTTLPPPPTITAVSDYDFQAGTQITLTGKGFASVSAIKLKATGDACTIVSHNDSTLVMTMPTNSTATESNLLFTYTSGTNTNAQAISGAVFNNLDNAYLIFADSKFQNSWGDNSWQAPSGVSTGASHSGSSSIVATYPSNGWKIEGWANWYPSFPYDASYKYLTFWVKGGKADHTLTLVGDKIAGGYGQNTSPAAIQQIDVPPGVWTFYKIPLGTGANQLNYWATGSPAQQLGFFLKGQSTDPDETMYFDEVAFLK